VVEVEKFYVKKATEFRITIIQLLFLKALTAKILSGSFSWNSSFFDSIIKKKWLIVLISHFFE
jgi:hypothetical protein